ncbi:MAG: hypothetical protein PVG91_03315 [Gammaproteobacteria bacterium]
MPIRLLLSCLLVLPAVVFADAGSGQFMGYELGANYPETPQDSQSTTTGNLLILAEDPVKPADIQQVNLVVTPVSRTIGYISASSWHATEDEARKMGRRYVELLRTKYPDWKFGRETMDANLRIVEVNLDKAPYNLQLRIVRDEHEGSAMWRFSMGLGWQANTRERLSWQDMSATQQAEQKAAKREQLLKDPDLRGL